MMESKIALTSWYNHIDPFSSTVYAFIYLLLCLGCLKIFATKWMQLLELSGGAMIKGLEKCTWLIGTKFVSLGMREV